MVVTCYSQTRSRPRLPISLDCFQRNQRWSLVFVYVCVYVKWEREDQWWHGPRATERWNTGGTYMSAECERICRLLWCFRPFHAQRARIRRRRASRRTGSRLFSFPKLFLPFLPAASNRERPCFNSRFVFPFFLSLSLSIARCTTRLDAVTLLDSVIFRFYFENWTCS